MADAHTVSKQIYEQLVSHTRGKPPAMRSWTGEIWGPDDAISTIVLRHPGSLRATLFPPSDLTAGEAYVFDDIDIEGDIFALLQWASHLDALRTSPRAVGNLIRLLRHLPNENRHRDATRPEKQGRLHSLRRDSDVVRYHYDTGNDFFSLFLDPLMVYSCAYFLDESETLETAQQRKLDLICRKLQLQPGQRLLDVGCGWGALARHAAANYGVDVLGVTLSPEQAAEARLRNHVEGLTDRVTIEVQDYRDVVGQFDAIASIGMFEHVGQKMLETYFTKLHGLLAPDGVLLNHAITNRVRTRRPQRRKPSFVNTYVFPDGELLPIESSVQVAEAAGFETRDVENLRTSYALTLRHWVANLEASHKKAVEAANETTYRIWRMYMAGSVTAFELAALAVYQVIYTKRDTPWTWGRRWTTAADDMS